MKRLVIVLPFATLVALSLFSFMVWMVGVGHQSPPDLKSSLRFDMVMVEAERTPQRRQRERPEPHKRPQTPPAQGLAPANLPKQVLMTSMPDLPDFTMDTSVTGINIAIPQLLSVGKNQPVMPLYRVEPRYPVRALQRKIEGYVKLSFTIDEQGKPTDIRVIEEQPPRIFSREAITALKRWKYSPRLVEGVAKSREGQTVKLEFRIQP